MTADRGLLERANAAVSRGAWADAFELLRAARAAGQLTVAELPWYAEVAYAAGHLDVTIETWEEVYAEHLACGANGEAAGAAVRVAMHLLVDTALMAPVRGWLARAERLLDGEHLAADAWFAVVRSYERLLTGDLAAAREWARRAVEIGSEVDTAAAAIGRVGYARLVILDGEVERGLALLDEAAVAVTSGDLDPMSTGIVYCELVCALQGLAQYDLAEQWTEAMERWSRTNAIGSLHGRCRVHRAEILRLRGHYEDAEEQALLACDELRPYLRRELGWPLTELARIHLRRGDLDAVDEALAEVQRLYWDPEPVLSLARLARGDGVGAASSIREALERETHDVPSKEQPPSTELRRAPLLEAQVEIAVATSDLETASAGAAELEAIATRFGSRSLVASARHARARVVLAEGDAATASQLFSEAARMWAEIGAPYETAMARIGLADACRADGHEDRAARELASARAVLDGLASVAREQAGSSATSSASTFRCDGDYWTAAFSGRAVRVRDARGMHHLARLLAEPGREFHVLDLATSGADAAPGTRRPDFGDAGELLDDRAKDAYRRRLADIDEDIEEALASGDAERESQARTERQFLVDELARAVGLGGRDRRAGVVSERARSAVTQAVRRAIARLAQVHPELGEHLEHAVRTGTYCAYLPDPRSSPTWET